MEWIVDVAVTVDVVTVNVAVTVGAVSTLRIGTFRRSELTLVSGTR
jgi:hypothetical protein